MRPHNFQCHFFLSFFSCFQLFSIPVQLLLSSFKTCLPNQAFDISIAQQHPSPTFPGWNKVLYSYVGRPSARPLCPVASPPLLTTKTNQTKPNKFKPNVVCDKLTNLSQLNSKCCMGQLNQTKPNLIVIWGNKTKQNPTKTNKSNQTQPNQIEKKVVEINLLNLVLTMFNLICVISVLTRFSACL